MYKGIVTYTKENDETIQYHFHDMLDNETIEEYMIRNNLKFKKIVDCYISEIEKKNKI